LNPLTTLIMQLVGVGGIEWIIIIVIFLGLMFGSKKLPQIARSLGRITTEYEKARVQVSSEIEMAKSQDIYGNKNLDREKLEDISDILGIDYSDKKDDELRLAIDSEIRKTEK
jgi:sec-independent protein translocase protein TatA